MEILKCPSLLQWCEMLAWVSGTKAKQQLVMTGSYVNRFSESGNWTFLENSSARTERMPRRVLVHTNVHGSHLHTVPCLGLPTDSCI